MTKKKIVLYQPQQVDASIGRRSSGDMLPLEMLTIGAYPDRDGYEIVIVDGSLYTQEEAHRRAVRGVRGRAAVCDHRHPRLHGHRRLSLHDQGQGALPQAAARDRRLVRVGAPELQLATGLYDAVAFGQGELAFRDIVRAIDAGEPLDNVEGLALWRDGQVVKTPKRAVVGWDQVLNAAWHLLDIEPYRARQMEPGSHRHILRMPTPPAIGSRKPYFGITTSRATVARSRAPSVARRSSPIAVGRRCRPSGCSTTSPGCKSAGASTPSASTTPTSACIQKRTKDFAEGMLRRNLKFWWNAFIETHSILSYKPEVLDAIAQSGMYVAEIGAEAGTNEMMKRIGKPIHDDENIAAAVEMDKRGVCASVTYIIGYPGEGPDSMLATIDQCRRLHLAAPRARPTVWPFRPIPGTAMWDEAIALGYEPPRTIQEWGSIGEYHLEGDLARQDPARSAEAPFALPALRDAELRPRARQDRLVGAARRTPAARQRLEVRRDRGEGLRQAAQRAAQALPQARDLALVGRPGPQDRHSRQQVLEVDQGHDGDHGRLSGRVRAGWAHSGAFAFNFSGAYLNANAVNVGDTLYAQWVDARSGRDREHRFVGRDPLHDLPLGPALDSAELLIRRGAAKSLRCPRSMHSPRQATPTDQSPRSGSAKAVSCTGS
jgi:hypothetical protein